jgi:RNA polymerase-associated protein CTR9
MQYMDVDGSDALVDTVEDGEAIMIPVRDSEELVRVNLDELPKDADEIIDILKAEFAPLDIWLKFAVGALLIVSEKSGSSLSVQLEYYKRGSVENFKLILDEGADEGRQALEYLLAHKITAVCTLPALDHQPAYSNETARKQRIAILNVLAAYYVKQATKTKDAQKEEFFNLATANYNKADKIDIHEEMTWVGKGIHSFIRCEVVYV